MSTGASVSPTMTRPLVQNSGNAYGPTDTAGYPAFQAVEATAPCNLEDGAMVVMYAAPGELIIVRPNGKYWDVEPISTTEESEELTLQFFPSVSIFSVVRKGKAIAFKSLAAEGRTLQAVAPDETVPLRVNNYNFGTWESWEVAGSELINKKWPRRTLGLEVREIQAVSVEDLRRLERHNLKMSKDMQKQVRTLELKLQETKRQLQEQSRSRRRMTVQHQREVEDSRSRLEEALRAKQRLEVDAVQTGARLKQKELQFQQLTLQRDTAEAALEQKEANHRAHEREIANLKEKHQSDIESLGRQHRNEIEALKRDREHERGRSTQHANGEVAILQQKLEQVEQEKDREVRRICMDHQAALQQKVNEISNLKEENQRLTMALQTIKDQLTRGFVAINSSEVAPSRAGTERSLDLPVSGYRYSPAPSRASTGRRADDANEGGHYPFGESGMTPRRCSLPCPPPHSPYGRHSPATSPEPFALRTVADFRPRRGDSRLSDNTGLGRRSDEVPISLRRPGSGFARSHRHADALNSRYSSQLDSVEDHMHKEEESEFNDDASEHEARERRQNDESESEIDTRTNDTPRQIIEENEDAEEDEEEAEKVVDSDGLTISSEEELSMEQTAAADPEDALYDMAQRASDAPSSWDAEVAPQGQRPEPGSEAECRENSVKPAEE